MPFQAVPDCAGVEIRWTLPDNAPAEWSINFHYTLGVYDQTSLDALTAEVDAWVTSDALPSTSVAHVYRETYARGLSLEFDIESLNATGTDNGAVTGVPLPNEVALRLKFGTGFTGRSARGGVFLLSMPPSQLTTPNIVAAGFRSAWVTAFDDLFDLTNAIGWQGVVVQRYEDGTLLLPNADFRVITTVSAVDDILDSQRGRKPKP